MKLSEVKTMALKELETNVLFTAFEKLDLEEKIQNSENLEVVGAIGALLFCNDGLRNITAFYDDECRNEVFKLANML